MQCRVPSAASPISSPESLRSSPLQTSSKVRVPGISFDTIRTTHEVTAALSEFLYGQGALSPSRPFVPNGLRARLCETGHEASILAIRSRGTHQPEIDNMLPIHGKICD